MREIICLRCQTKMKYLKTENIQLGKTGWILGDLPNLLSGALESAIYVCPNCGKIEFFQVKDEKADEALPQKQCPICGKWHDFDYPRCPFCKHYYYE